MGMNSQSQREGQKYVHPGQRVCLPLLKSLKICKLSRQRTGPLCFCVSASPWRVAAHVILASKEQKCLRTVFEAQGISSASCWLIK